MLVFLQELTERVGGFVLASVADQIQRLIFAQWALIVRASGAFHDGGDARRIRQRYQVRKWRKVLVYLGDGVLDQGPPRC
jgi:hypothetical protein